MAGSMTFGLSTAVLEWARTSMGYTIEQAADKAGVTSDRYQSWENGNSLPTYKQLEKLAENVYKRPLAVLLMPAPPSEESIERDFRTLSNIEATHLSPQIRLALRKAKRYQLILEEVTGPEDGPNFRDFNLNPQTDPVKSAAAFRHFINLTIAEQKSWKGEEAFNHLQKKIESIGIYVFKMTMPIEDARAFCISGKFPIIVLNKDDARNGRIFSLAHEVCHILLNENDVFKDKEAWDIERTHIQTEDFCNRFAGAFLVPDEFFLKDIQFIQNGTDADIQRLAREYNVSSEVIARKLLENRLITGDFFWARKRMWDAAARSAKQKENEKLKDSEGGISQATKIIYEKGKPYVSKVINAFRQGTLSSSDLSGYLETKLDHLPKIIEKLGK